MSNCFLNNDNEIEKQSQNFSKILFRKFKLCFPKIRFNNRNKQGYINDLISLRNKLRQQSKVTNTSIDTNIEDEIANVEKKITDLVEDEKLKKFMNLFGPFTEDNLPSNTNQSIWNIKRKIYKPQNSSYPVAKYNPEGRLVTDSNELKSLTLEHFKNRLRNRPIHQGFENLKCLKEELCQKLIQLVKMIPYKEWTMNQLENVLKTIKKNKAQDPYGLIGELF